MSAEPAESKVRLLAQVSAERSPTRREVRLLAGVGAALGILVSVCAFLAVGGFREGGLPRDPRLIAWTVSGTAALAAAAAAWSVRRGRTLGAPRAVLRGLIVALPLVLFAWKVGVSSFFPGGTDWDPARVGLRCLGVGHLVGLPVLAGFFVARWRTDPLHPGLTAAALGATAGVFAALLVDLWCPVGHPGHVLLGHVLPVVSLTLLAWALGRRVVAA